MNSNLLSKQKSWSTPIDGSIVNIDAQPQAFGLLGQALSRKDRAEVYSPGCYFLL